MYMAFTIGSPQVVPSVDVNSGLLAMNYLTGALHVLTNIVGK